jgi:hypothetical protein
MMDSSEIRLSVIHWARLVVGSVIAIYLVFFEVPTVYCEWFACSVQAIFHWYQPVLCLVAAYMLCRSFWQLCHTSNIRDYAGVTYPPPCDAHWQQNSHAHSSWPRQYVHFDVDFN